MKLNLLYLLFTITSIGFGQTLENSYTTNGFDDYILKKFTFLTENNLFYLTLDSPNNQISIFNSDHSLYTTISLTFPTDYELGSLHFASDKLFNSDSKIEILIAANYTGSENCSYCREKMLLFNEDGGDNIFDFGKRMKANVFKDIDNNYKLMTYSEYDQNDDDDTGNNDLLYYDIYSLSGTLSIAQEDYLLNAQRIFSFPNPSSTKINITNPLENYENEKIEVYDMNGRKVLEKEIIGNGENIELDISNLSQGVYNYKIRNYGNKFIKN